jgi:hypothetical protein
MMDIVAGEADTPPLVEADTTGAEEPGRIPEISPTPETAEPVTPPGGGTAGAEGPTGDTTEEATLEVAATHIEETSAFTAATLEEAGTLEEPDTLPVGRLELIEETEQEEPTGRLTAEEEENPQDPEEDLQT